MSLLTTIAIIILSSLALISIFKKINFPPLIGMLIIGIILGPYALNVISPDLLNISTDLRQLALIIILTRAGLSLNLGVLKKVGRPAILLSFVPACFEILGCIVFGTMLLKLSILESALLGSVLAAVSPAVLVPRMLNISKLGYGNDKGIPQMLTAGSSMDDIFVVVIFTSLLSMASSGIFDANVFWEIPTSIVLGIGVGCLLGYLLSIFFKKFHIRDTVKVLLLLSLSFLIIGIENIISKIVPFSGLLAIVALGVFYNFKDENRSLRLANRYEKLWVCAEILLFVLVGAEVDISYTFSLGFVPIAVILLALIFRLVGVLLCLTKTKLNLHERLFCCFSYTPKATVQAAIGSLALSAGLACGQTILTCAVVSILITAPLGALFIDISYKKLLKKDLSRFS